MVVNLPLVGIAGRRVFRGDHASPQPPTGPEDTSAIKSFRCWTVIDGPMKNLNKINMWYNIWLVVSTHLKKNSQNGNLPQIGVRIKTLWVATTYTTTAKKNPRTFNLYDTYDEGNWNIYIQFGWFSNGFPCRQVYLSSHEHPSWDDMKRPYMKLPSTRGITSGQIYNSSPT